MKALYRKDGQGTNCFYKSLTDDMGVWPMTECQAICFVPPSLKIAEKCYSGEINRYHALLLLIDLFEHVLFECKQMDKPYKAGNHE